MYAALSGGSDNPQRSHEPRISNIDPLRQRHWPCNASVLSGPGEVTGANRSVGPADGWLRSMSMPL
jgi:hypothetical protein